MEEVELMSNKELKTLLEGTGIKNDFGEKRDIYLELLRFAGAETCDKRDRRSTDYLMDKKIIMYINNHNPFFQTEWSDCYGGDFCELNLSMLKSLHKRFIPAKPKTRTEYVKVEFDHAWEAVKAWDEGEELFVKNPLVSSQKYIIAEFSSLRFPQNLYRAVEKEITWKDELKEILSCMDIDIGTDDGYVSFPECGFKDDSFIAMCKFVADNVQK